MPSPKKKVLFLCTGNACRSQMAEGLLRHLAGDRYEVISAGIFPTRVHPLAVKVMAEMGIDISHHTSNHVDEYLDKNIDILISVCDFAKEACPYFPGSVERIHWSIPDPFRGWGADEEFFNSFRACRDLLNTHIQQFLASRDSVGKSLQKKGQSGS